MAPLSVEKSRMEQISQACVGYPDGEQMHRVWFSRWFLDQCYFDAPAVIWQRGGNIITRTYKPEYRRPSGRPNAAPMIWKLTDQRDDDERLEDHLDGEWGLPAWELEHID